MPPHPVPERPWQKVGVDIFTFQRKDYLLVVDYYSKYPEIAHLPDKTASTVVLQLKEIFARHGIPEEMTSDNMPFSSRKMSEFAEEWKFSQSTSSPHYAQSNGQAERAIQTVKNMLRKANEAGTDPYVALLQYRNTPVAGCDYSPAQMLFSRSLRTKLPVAAEQLIPAIVTPRDQLYATVSRNKRIILIVTRKRCHHCKPMTSYACSVTANGNAVACNGHMSLRARTSSRPKTGRRCAETGATSSKQRRTHHCVRRTSTISQRPSVPRHKRRH